MTTYRIKAKYYSDREWLNCKIDITVDEEGKVEAIEQVHYD